MIMADPKIDMHTRLQAASNISKYFHPAYGNIPQRPDPLFYDQPIQYPNPTPTTIAQVRANINFLTHISPHSLRCRPARAARRRTRAHLDSKAISRAARLVLGVCPMPQAPRAAGTPAVLAFNGFGQRMIRAVRERVPVDDQ
jgi:hypothetical protein